MCAIIKTPNEREVTKMKMYEFIANGMVMVGTGKDLGRAQDKYGYRNVKVLRSWEV